MPKSDKYDAGRRLTGCLADVAESVVRWRHAPVRSATRCRSPLSGDASDLDGIGMENFFVGAGLATPRSFKKQLFFRQKSC